jgi:hypothetical protein
VEALSEFIARLRLSCIVAGVFVLLSLVAGYLLAGWWYGFGAQDVTPVEQICARIEHLDSLLDDLPEQRAPSEEIRNEFAMLVEQGQEALGNSFEQNE